MYVYRIKARPHYADAASTYAYKYMYKKDNPTYFISTDLYHQSPSYCSRYVYLSYWWGATKSALIFYKTNTHIVTPHGLAGNFKVLSNQLIFIKLLLIEVKHENKKNYPFHNYIYTW